jgi:hypothetical protein
MSVPEPEKIELTDDRRMPYQLPYPVEAQSEIVIPSAVPDDERVWVPQMENVWFRPLCLNTSQGYWVNLLRVRRSGVLTRHRHPTPVHGLRWKASGQPTGVNWKIDQRLHESPPLGKRPGSQDGRHRNFGETIGNTVLLCFLFAQADSGELRVGEQAEGYLPSGRHAISAGDVVPHDAKIIKRDMGEVGAAGTIPAGPHTFSRGFAAPNRQIVVIVS